MNDPVRTSPELPSDALERWIAWTCYLTGFRPHPGQVRAIEAISRRRFVGLYCGRRWGKSKLLARIALAKALEGNKVVWTIAPTYELTKRVFRPVKHIALMLLPKALARNKMPPVRVTRTLDSNAERLLEFSNGSLIQAKSADNAESLLGEGVDLALLDESARMRREIWEHFILPTLLDTEGTSVHATTPTGIGDWTHENYIRGQYGTDPDWESIQSPSWENPHLPAGAIERFKRVMSRMSFRQEIGAEFEAREGRVFPSFDRRRHVQHIDYQRGLPVCVGVDFGFRFFAMVAVQVNKRGEVEQFDEGLWTEISTGEAIQKIQTKPWSRWIELIATDPAGKARNLQTKRSDVELFREAFPYALVDYSTQPDHRDPEWRAARLRDRLLSASGEIHYLVDPRCRETIKTWEQSVYPEGRRLVEQPEKDGEVDHIRDALGYLEVCKFHRRHSRFLAERPF